MIPTRGWRDREARARARGRSLDPAISAELERHMVEREARLATLTIAADVVAPVGIASVATMIPNEPAAPVADVTPDEDEAVIDDTINAEITTAELAPAAPAVTKTRKKT